MISIISTVIRREKPKQSEKPARQAAQGLAARHLAQLLRQGQEESARSARPVRQDRRRFSRQKRQSPKSPPSRLKPRSRLHRLPRSRRTSTRLRGSSQSQGALWLSRQALLSLRSSQPPLVSSATTFTARTRRTLRSNSPRASRFLSTTSTASVPSRSRNTRGSSIKKTGVARST